MKKILLILALISLVLLIGCEDGIGKTEVVKGRLYIKTHCEDGVVCYRNDMGIHSGVSCFRDDDLVAKYC